VDAGAKSDQPVNDSSAPVQPANPSVVSFWHSWGAANHPNKPVVDEVAAFLEKKYNIKIEQDFTDFNSYRVKLSVAYSANEGPDIARGWSLSSMAPYVQGGKLLALDNYLTADYKAKLIPNATDNMTFNGKIYGLPMGISVQVLFVNRPKFEAEGLPLPTDWDKLVNAIKIFKSKGIVPMSLGAKTPGVLDHYFDSIQLHAAGPVALQAALRKETGYSAPEFLQAVMKLKELIDLGAFSPAAAGMTRDEAEVDVFNGKIPMYFHGNWVVSQFYMDSSKVDPNDIEILPMPAWQGAKGNPMDIVGVVGDAFFVNVNTKYPQFMTEVMQDLAYGFARGIYVRGGGVPAYNITDVDVSKLRPLFVKLVNLVNKANSVTAYTDLLLSGDETERFEQSLQSLLIGAITPEQHIATMNAINQGK
jgi:raffinose/stachyose/melibiose transport system substrate-binding protein